MPGKFLHSSSSSCWLLMLFHLLKIQPLYMKKFTKNNWSHICITVILFHKFTLFGWLAWIDLKKIEDMHQKRAACSSDISILLKNLLYIMQNSTGSHTATKQINVQTQQQFLTLFTTWFNTIRTNMNTQCFQNSTILQWVCGHFLGWWHVAHIPHNPYCSFVLLLFR